MKDYFIASLIEGGILGGGITTDEEGITYHTNKLTVPDRLKNLRIRFDEMETYSTKRIMLFPVFRIKTSFEEYRFIVFNAQDFERILAEGMLTDITE